MEKPIVVLDLSEGSAKILIGTQIGGKPVIAYSDTRDISAYFENGQLVDKEGLHNVIAEMKEINDPITHLSISVNNGACYIAPALGLTVYQIPETTNVVSNENEIARIDISNLHSKILKNEFPGGVKIVDIIPDYFVLSNGEQYVNPPVGKISPSLSVYAKIHCLPESAFSSYTRAITETGLRILRVSVAPLCQAEYFKTYPDLPRSYLLVDMGYHQTSVSLIGEGSPYGSMTIYQGGADLTAHIAESLGLGFAEAERLKIEYGYDTRPCTYEAPYASGQDENGKKFRIGAKQVNAAIESFYEEYLHLLDNAITTLLKDYNGAYDDMPMIITGGASSLYGLDEIVGKFFTRRERFYPELRTVGTRDRGFAGALGMILVASRYTGSMVDDYKGVSNLSRPVKTEKKEKRNPGAEYDAL